MIKIDLEQNTGFYFFANGKVKKNKKIKGHHHHHRHHQAVLIARILTTLYLYIYISIALAIYSFWHPVFPYLLNVLSGSGGGEQCKSSLAVRCRMSMTNLFFLFQRCHPPKFALLSQITRERRRRWSLSCLFLYSAVSMVKSIEPFYTCNLAYFSIVFSMFMWC